MFILYEAAHYLITLMKRFTNYNTNLFSAN